MAPLVITIKNVTTGEQRLRAFYRSPVHVGRNELNDLPLPNGYVSLWHAVIRFDDEAVRYTDLGSKNGSEVGGARVDANKVVDVGPQVPVQIGELRLEFSRDEALAEAADREPGTLFGSSGDGGADQPPAESVSTRFYEVPKDLVLPRPSAPPPRRAPEPAPAPPPRRAPEPPPPADLEEPSTERTARPRVAAPIPLREVTSATHEPPPQRAPRGPAGSASALVDGAMSDYVRFRDAWKSLRLDLTHGLKSLPREERTRALDVIKERMPQVLKEEEFQVMLNALGIASRRTLARMTGEESAPAAPAPAPAPSRSSGPSEADGAAQKLIGRFARSYVPGAPQSPPPSESEKMMERVADVLETCAKMFVEFRKGHGQFADHMAVRVQQREGALGEAKDAREVLAYVLDWRQGGHARVDELKDGFKQFMVHEIALLQGLRAGVQELMESMNPEKISEDAGSSLLGSGGKWKKFVEIYEDLAEEQTLTRKLFGNAFWRAYTAVVQESE
ncbi:MAG TPA: type VI secretion system-associated FHA domain protein [Myxococcales bacterium]|nr:type VI secretion system-associated FHA domain protein [Myxococcales bacterium]